MAELASLRFQGDVWSVPEGTVVFAGETLLRVTALAVELEQRNDVPHTPKAHVFTEIQSCCLRLLLRDDAVPVRLIAFRCFAAGALTARRLPLRVLLPAGFADG